MFKRLVVIALLSLLCGCSKKEQVESDTGPPPISIQAEVGLLDEFTIDAIGSVCGFNNIEGGIKIYPYYNNPSHIKLKKILISENDFWNTLINSQSEEFILTKADKFTLITTPDGVTYSYYPIDTEWAIIGSTQGLNSGYLMLVMDGLWKQST